MSFDPYYKWLAIPPKYQPPNHYRLLGIELFEADADVIDSAAHQRIAHVRTFQTGKHSAESQRLLNEIAAARVCLLSPEKRAAYDASLQRQLAAAVEPELGRAVSSDVPSLFGDVSLSPLPSLPVEPVPVLGGDRTRHNRKQPLAAMLAVGLTIALILGAGALWLGVERSRVRDGRGERNGPPSPAPVIEQPLSAPPSTPVPPPAAPGPAPSPSVEPVASPGPTTPAPDHLPRPESAPARSEKLPPPAAESERRAKGEVQDLLAGRDAKTLQDAAMVSDRDPAQRFVLLDAARDLAADSGDAVAALAAIDQINRHYEIDALAMKAETLDRLVQTARSAERFRAIAESGMTLVDDARARGDRALASRLAVTALVAARKADDVSLMRAATLKVMENRAE